MSNRLPDRYRYLRDPRKPSFEVDEEKQAKAREFPTDEAADLAERFLRKLAAVEGINAPLLRRREGRRLEMDYLPGTALTVSPHAEMINTAAALQARLHSLDWPDFGDRVACIENYKRYFKDYLDQYVSLGLLPEPGQKRIAKRFEAVIPWEMHPALVHDDLWGGNVLMYRGDIYLIDYASVKFLSLESDVLNSSRYFQTRIERYLKGRYSFKTRYLRVYQEHGRRMREVVQVLGANNPFFLAFNLLRKGRNMLLRSHETEQARRRGLAFSLRRLREARKILKA